MSEPMQPEKDTWQQGTGLCTGLVLGAVLGLSVFDDIGLGMAIGVASGLVVDAIALVGVTGEKAEIRTRRNGDGGSRRPHEAGELTPTDGSPACWSPSSPRSGRGSR